MFLLLDITKLLIYFKVNSGCPFSEWPWFGQPWHSRGYHGNGGWIWFVLLFLSSLSQHLFILLSLMLLSFSCKIIFIIRSSIWFQFLRILVESQNLFGNYKKEFIILWIFKITAINSILFLRTTNPKAAFKDLSIFWNNGDE